MTPKYRNQTTTGYVMTATGRERNTPSHRLLVRRPAVCSSSVEGAPSARSGGATSMRSRCCTT